MDSLCLKKGWVGGGEGPVAVVVGRWQLEGGPGR